MIAVMASGNDDGVADLVGSEQAVATTVRPTPERKARRFMTRTGSG
jgi:hypothetical protein